MWRGGLSSALRLEPGQSRPWERPGRPWEQRGMSGGQANRTPAGQALLVSKTGVNERKDALAPHQPEGGRVAVGN